MFEQNGAPVSCDNNYSKELAVERRDDIKQLEDHSRIERKRERMLLHPDGERYKLGRASYRLLEQ
jgi:hypothetical protein